VFDKPATDKKELDSISIWAKRNYSVVHNEKVKSPFFMDDLTNKTS